MVETKATVIIITKEKTKDRGIQTTNFRLADQKNLKAQKQLSVRMSSFEILT